MKKIFVGLLIAAIGAGIYLYFSKKEQTSAENSRELIIGKWKVDSLVFRKDTSMAGKLFSHLFDSDANKYNIEFAKNGFVLTTYDGKVRDTSHYELPGNTILLISDENGGDKEKWDITKLDSLMIAKDKDSTVFHFSRIKNQ
ncbi:MAG TPA: hypothetical protein VFP87_13085 [Chitinophagaceae bacterium]|nr:hypothetical protein [Chitinophagaceae bacterium]